MIASGSRRKNRNAARPDGRSRISSHGLRQNLRRSAASGSCFAIADRRSSFVMIQNFFARSQRQQSRHRLLDHRLFAVERQQLLGALLAAERPETRAAPSGQNHGIEIYVLRQGFSQALLFAARNSAHHSGFRLRQRFSGHVRPQELQRPLRPHAELAAHMLAPQPRRLWSSVTGSMPAASITPQPSTATRICTELRPESSRVANSSGSLASNMSTTK